MAKRYRRTRRSFPSFKRYRKSSAGGGTGALMATVVGAGVYGAIRAKLAQAVEPLTRNIPMGNIADEVALGALAVVLKRTVARRMPMVTPVLNGAIAIESARIGEALISGQVMTTGASTNQNLYG